jgi:hypothetical protein
MVNVLQVLPFPLQLQLTSVLSSTVYDAIPSTLGGFVRFCPPPATCSIFKSFVQRVLQHNIDVSQQ